MLSEGERVFIQKVVGPGRDPSPSATFGHSDRPWRNVRLAGKRSENSRPHPSDIAPDKPHRCLAVLSPFPLEHRPGLRPAAGDLSLLRLASEKRERLAFAAIVEYREHTETTP